VISSPYARRGEVYNTHRQHFGEKGDPRILVAQGASRDFNPSLPQEVVDRAFARDPAAAAAEYGGLFRSDVENFISREVVEAAVVPGRHELPPVDGIEYYAFVDPSGGSSDSMTLAIAHNKDGRVILDAVRERKPPFSPADVVAEFVTLLKSYRIDKVTGDRWGGEFVREPFRSGGVQYELAEKPKSDQYRDALPNLNSGKTELLDHSRIVNQLCSLERRTARGGRDSIDHAPGAHDDLANAVAGVIGLAQPAAEPGIIGYMRNLVEEARTTVAGSPPFGWSKPEEKAAAARVKLRAPVGISNVSGQFGTAYVVGPDRVVEVDARDAPPLLAAAGGWEQIASAPPPDIGGDQTTEMGVSA
jgi:hypothetical protein